jgi:hypothetical protein
MSNKAVLLEKYRLAVELSEPMAPLDYLQLRNREALREWRIKRALGSPALPLQANPGFSHRTRGRLGELLASLHGHPA